MFKEEIKKFGEFKEDMTQKSMGLSLTLSNVNMEETNKN